MDKLLFICLVVFLAIIHVGLSHRDLRRGRRKGRGRERWGGGRPRWSPRHNWWDLLDLDFARGGRHNFNFELGFGGNSFFDIEMQWSNAWWKGPNVCYTKSESIDEDASHLSGSSVLYHDTYDTFKISKTRMTRRGLVTTTDLYECCDGYTRTGNELGCPKEIPIQTMKEMLTKLDLTEFVKLINSTGLDEDVLDTENTKLTIFVPSNDALKDYLPLASARSMKDYLKDMPSVIMVSQDISESVVDEARNLLLGHMVVGRKTSSTFENDQLLETTSPFQTSIRMNVYTGLAEIVNTANCQKITSSDNIATNGVIHVVDGVLKPVSDTLLDLIKKNPELSTLKTALGSSQLGAMLRDDNGHYTILAPTDAAFQKHEALLRKITSDPDCMENVLKNHIIHLTLCSSAISGRVVTKNLLNKRLDLSRDDDDKMYVEDIQVVTTDLMATNGVLYIIDDVLIPDEALDILQLVEKNDLVEFGKLVDIAGMKKELTAAENLTVFVPSNEAIKALPEKLRSELTKDDQALKDLLQYHMVSERLDRKRHMLNGLLLNTVEGSSLRINEYSEFFFRKRTQTVQCSIIQREDFRGCGSTVYVIDKVLLPPAGNVVDVLAQDKRFSILVELLKMSKLADTLQETGPYTVFAPTDEVFKALGTDAVEELKDNPSTLKSILTNHVSRDAICCAGISNPGMFMAQRVRTLSGAVFGIGKRFSDTYYFADADVTECDVMASNGIVHVIDDVITGRRNLRPSFWE